MRFHLTCFGGAKTDSTNNEAIPAPIDPAWNRVSATEYLAPYDMDVFGAIVGNDTITRARLNTPSMRTLGLPEIWPVNQAALAAAPLAADWREIDPIRIRQNDTFSVECSNGASTVDTAYAALMIRRQKFPVPPGPRFTLSGTAAQTLVANGFSQGTITFDQTPPVGTYSVIGAACTCVNGWFFRLIFPANSNWRPGFLVSQAVTVFEARQLTRHGNLGEWGQFYSVNLPMLEIFGATAGAQTPRLYLDLVQIAPNNAVAITPPPGQGYQG